MIEVQMTRSMMKLFHNTLYVPNGCSRGEDPFKSCDCGFLVDCRVTKLLSDQQFGAHRNFCVLPMSLAICVPA